MYVHAGGSPQAIRKLNKKGNGEWVYNADQFRWGTGPRAAPASRGAISGEPRSASRPTTSTRTASTSGGSRRGCGADDDADGAGLDVRAGQGDRASPGRRADPRELPGRDDHLSLRRRHEQLRALCRRQQAAPGGSRRRAGRRAEERRDPADGLRGAQGQPAPRPARGAQHRQGRGLDLDRRRDCQGRVAEEVGEGADPALRPRRPADHPDRGPDVHRGHPDLVHVQDRDGAPASAIAPRFVGVLGP